MAGIGKRVRRRVERAVAAPWLLEGVAGFAAGRIRAWQRRIPWEVRGQEDLAVHLAERGPVILAVWHGRLAMTPSMWRRDWGPILSLTSKARPGQIVGRTLGRFGWGTVAMRDRRTNRAASIQVARAIRAGASVGIACDGPVGPARCMRTVPLDWARLSGAPIWLWTFSVDRPSHLASWDRMILPHKARRGVMLYQPWEVAVPKRIDPTEMESLRVRLEADLDDLTLRADREMGHSGICA